MERREFLKKTALASAATVVGSRIPLLTPNAFADGSADATVGCLWGIHAEPRTKGGTIYSALTNLEKKVGRRFAVDRQ
jgi:anaerobic selenocysteine-containing dehydrogenase